ncbi:MAG: hypothetical protein ACFFCY_03175 [Promethearchaeota archaeon]
MNILHAKKYEKLKKNLFRAGYAPSARCQHPSYPIPTTYQLSISSVT